MSYENADGSLNLKTINDAYWAVPDDSYDWDVKNRWRYDGGHGVTVQRLTEKTHPNARTLGAGSFYLTFNDQPFAIFGYNYAHAQMVILPVADEFKTREWHENVNRLLADNEIGFRLLMPVEVFRVYKAEQCLPKGQRDFGFGTGVVFYQRIAGMPWEYAEPGVHEEAKVSWNYHIKSDLAIDIDELEYDRW